MMCRAGLDRNVAKNTSTRFSRQSVRPVPANLLARQPAQLSDQGRRAQVSSSRGQQCHG